MDSAGDIATDRFVSEAPKLGHQPPLDGLRGVAIVGVLMVHAALNMFPSLVAGVDVFFVVSGFLITTLLLEEDRRAGAVSLRHFYIRRARRLLPVLYIVIGVTLVSVFVITRIYGSGASAVVPNNLTMGALWHRTVQDAVAGGLYMYHVVFPAASGEVVSGGAAEIRPMIQLWSLSVEEHYYVFGVLITLWAVHRRNVRLVVGAFLSAWVFVAVARALGHLGPRLAWYQRPDGIVIGVLLAFLNARLPELSETFQRRLGRAATVAVGLVAVTVFLGTGFAKVIGVFVPYAPEPGGSLSDGLYWGRFGFSLCGLGVATIILAVVRCDRHWLRPALSWGPLRALGLRSYSIYVIHVPLFIILANGFKSAPAVALLLYIPLLVLLTELMHRYVERPMMKRRFSS